MARNWLQLLPLLVLLLLPALGPASVRADTQPVLSPITADFVEAEKATHYTAEVTNTTIKPTYFWKLTPPTDDPTCKNFEVTAAGDEAIWHHSESAADACHHFGIQHNGLITLDVVVGAWHCEATYAGTLDGTGPTPEPCIASVTPPPTPCTCVDLTLKIDGTLLNKKRLRPDKHDFGVGFDWFMTCGKGDGGCFVDQKGHLKLHP